MNKPVLTLAAALICFNAFGAEKITNDDRSAIMGVNADGSINTAITSPLENGDLTVLVQDQTSAPILVYLNEVECQTTITNAFSIDDYTVDVADATGFDVGDYVGVFSTNGGRFYAATVLGVSGTTITFDTPSDYDFDVGDPIQCGTKEMNVDGSGTNRVFSLRADPALDLTVDITRIIIRITDQTSMDTAKFGGIAALTKGVVLRRTDGYNSNIFNVKSNGEFSELAYDTAYATKAPSGFFGFNCRLTFAGQSKIGVTIRVGPNEDIELIVQDDLTDLDSFRVMVEGHIVID